MMIRFAKTLLCSAALVCAVVPAFGKEGEVLDHKVKSIDGKEVNLEDYKGKVLLVVNVASQCGLTPQYTALQELNEKYHEKGLDVLGFPCNQFRKQEPGTDAQIKEFCESKYKVTFDMFSKIDVNGEEADPFYKELTATDTKPTGSGDISWNFEKFVIGKDGKVAARFAPKTTPNDPEVIKVIEAELAK